MENTYRLKIKIGQHEFEAEGPAQIVQEQFESFKQLVSTMPVQQAPQAQNPPQEPENPVTMPQEESYGELDVSQLSKIMKKEGRLVSLTVRAKSIEDACLLVIYGQRALRGMELTTGGEIMDGLTATGGMSVARVDRLLEKLGREGDVIVTGTRRSKRYRLTNSGFAKAQRVASDLLTTVV